MTASGDQKSLVFSGVFAMVWIGEAVVTMQIKLLGGNMYAFCNNLSSSNPEAYKNTNTLCTQILLSVRMYNRLYIVSAGHRGSA